MFDSTDFRRRQGPRSGARSLRPRGFTLGSAAAAVLALWAPSAWSQTLPDLPPESADPASATSELGPKDPWEGFNRRAFAFNRGLDRHVIGPIGHGYMRLTPKFLRNRIGSVVDNLGEPGTAINDVAQGRPRRAGVTTSRFLINSTLGGLGLFDVGSRMGLERHDSDFGQTLGRYGAGSGRYVVLPLVGPTTVRDGLGSVVDVLSDPVSIAGGGGFTNFGLARSGASTLDARADADGMIRALDSATDPYATVRSAYLQRRAQMVRTARGEVEVLPDFDGADIQP